MRSFSQLLRCSSVVGPDDQPLWPEAPDGDGLSLVLIDPMGNPDHTDPLNWRSSVSPGGTPDGSDASEFAGNANDDSDQDGVQALMEYAFGSSDSVSNDTVMPTGAAESLDAGSGPEDHFTISYRRNLAADDVEIEVQISTDLDDWFSGPGEVEFVRAVHNGDGTETVTYRSVLPMSAGMREFMRVKVSLR